MEILTEIQSMDDFEKDTPVNKRVLKNIETLMRLDKEEKTILESFVLQLHEKVKELLMPSKFNKFHQNLHGFRAYELPQWLAKLGDQLPKCCCEDYILWQNYLDKLIEKELSLTKSSSNTTTTSTSSKPRVPTHVEQNAIRYVGGSVIRKLNSKWRHDNVTKECLKEFLHDGGAEDHEDSTEEWLQITNRGGLYCINDIAFELFIEVEIFVYPILSSTNVTVNLDELYVSACRDSDILRVWNECTLVIDDTEKTNKLLYEIIQEWVKVRGHAIVDKEMENFKKQKADSIKEKALRTNLKRKIAFNKTT
jgi:hypothetical protein